MIVGHELQDAFVLRRTAALAIAIFALLLYAPTLCAAVRRIGPWSGRAQHFRCVTTIHGRRYDLSPFVASHPGGPTALLLAHGIDATALFESYHSLSLLPAKLLAKYELPSSSSVASASSLVGDATPRPGAAPAAAADPVYDAMRARVVGLFDARGRGTKASRTRLAYYALTLALWVTLLRGYAHGCWAALPLYVLCAWHVAGIGHDAAHFEVSAEPLVNSVLACCIGTISNPLQWYYQHTVGHHSHTNDADQDPDLHHYAPFLRVHAGVPHRPWHRAQHLLAFPFMLLFAFGQALWQPLVQPPLGRRDGSVWLVNGITPVLMQGRLRVAALSRGMLGLYVALHLLLPLWLAPSASRAVAFCLLLLGGTGAVFGLCSAINHLTPQAAAVGGAPDPAAAPGGLLHSWAARQAIASNNFCTGSTLAFWLSNGLNYQVEHHLFPGINHEHLPAIAPAVEATCAEFGVPYNSFDSWSAVATDFCAHLRELGRAEDEGERCSDVSCKDGN